MLRIRNHDNDEFAVVVPGLHGHGPVLGRHPAVRAARLGRNALPRYESGRHIPNGNANTVGRAHVRVCRAGRDIDPTRDFDSAIAHRCECEPCCACAVDEGTTYAPCEEATCTMMGTSFANQRVTEIELADFHNITCDLNVTGASALSTPRRRRAAITSKLVSVADMSAMAAMSSLTSARLCLTIRSTGTCPSGWAICRAISTR